jgi:phage tail-like protein
MDVNGTKYHLLLGGNDWRRAMGASPGVEWDEQDNAITLRKLPFHFPKSSNDRAPDLSDRRGAARDQFGNWFWIGADRREIRVQSSGTGNETHFWSYCDTACCVEEEHASFAPIEQPAPVAVEMQGLAVTSEHFLVAGILKPAGLLIFDLISGNPPRELHWPEDVPFDPWDFSAAPGGGLFILDRTNRRYWALDRHFNIVRDTTLSPPEIPTAFQSAFQPLDCPPVAEVRKAPPRGPITLDSAFALAIQDPVAIESLPDGTALILDHRSFLYRYRLARQLGAPVLADIPAFRSMAHDFTFVPNYQGPDASGEDRLYVVGEEGNQALAFRIDYSADQIRLEFTGDYVPMRLFDGRGVVTAGGQVYYDSAGRWVPLIAQKRPRFATSGTLARVFDSRQPDCTWHRLLLDACIPPGCAVNVYTRAAEESSAIESMPWTTEPGLYRRNDGPEIPFAPDQSTWELLFQRARGRYLELRLDLTASGTATPRLHALRVYYPRFSYLERYLPGVYREEPQPASFLDRLLANFEGLFTCIEDRIAAAQILFDVRSAPPEALEWLASWFGVAMDPAWDERKQRMFIGNAMTFFQYRGTVRGLRMALELAGNALADERIFSEEFASRPDAGQSIRIVEKFRLRRTPGILLGDPTSWTGLRAVQSAPRWKPEEGSARLHARYRQALQLPDTDFYPIQLPADTQRDVQWTEFSRSNLGFVPEASAADAPRWQDFLQRRYRRIAKLNQAYGTNFTRFSDAAVATVLPPDGPALADWFQFEGVVLPMRDAAHRFTILIPLACTTDPESQRQRMDLVKRVADLEKPAHTVFEVKLFWGMFRIGEARLGLDTVLGAGSRVPELLVPMVLGQGHVAEGYLSSWRNGIGPARKVLDCGCPC